jgi:hypothetical protein
MSETYTVTARRTVPETTASVSFTGKVFVQHLNHAGERAACVKLSDGFIAWGFGGTDEQAERAAVATARALR